MLADPQYVILFDHFARFLRVAHAQRLDVAPLKGAHLLSGVYPEHEGRGRLADLDFLVRERDFERCFALLEGLGFTRRRSATRPSTDAIAEDIGFHFELAPGQSILFEVHRHFERKGRHPVDYDAVWARAVPSAFDGVPCLRLAAEDHVLHAVLHAYTDRFLAPQRALRDVELLITRAGADLAIVSRRAREWECARATWLLLSLLRQSRPALDLGSALEALRPSQPIAAALRWL
ncbi:MAG TPA: nucleotidyltransferase family protein, partial [Polyangiales bacterium]|nr:nucleotidyltransferase family protein [Polyangiales bacterium]